MLVLVGFAGYCAGYRAGRAEGKLEAQSVRR
jgi:hypothetical protein